MKCPKCGSNDISYNAFIDVAACSDCKIEWTFWQQELLTAANKRVAELEKALYDIARETTDLVNKLTLEALAGKVQP